jgi:hypothetical protein
MIDKKVKPGKPEEYKRRSRVEHRKLLPLLLLSA